MKKVFISVMTVLALTGCGAHMTAVPVKEKEPLRIISSEDAAKMYDFAASDSRVRNLGKIRP